MRPLSIIYLYQNCGLYLRAACINYFSYYLRLVFEGSFYSRKYGICNLSSVDHSVSLTCSYCNVLNAFDQVLIWRFGLPTFLKTKLSPPILHLFFQLFTKVLINVKFGSFTENFLMADNVPNVNAWFPTSILTFSGISFWYFYGLPCDLSINLQQISTQRSWFHS